MLKHRLITGPILSLGIIGLLVLDNSLATSAFPDSSTVKAGIILTILAVLIAPIAAIEFGAIADGLGIRSCIPTIALTLIAWIAFFYYLPDSKSGTSTVAIASSILIGSFFLSIVSIAKSKTLSGVIAGAVYSTMTATYLGLAFGFLLLIRKEHDALWILGIIAIVKMCDTGAFFTGCSIGKHKLIPWISPGKTWEGLVGGVITASLTAMLLASLNNCYLQNEPTIPLAFAAIFGLILGFFGQCGDLVMSIFKRDSGLKDSSAVLPGLGGILDVLDSLILTSPIAYWLFHLL